MFKTSSRQIIRTQICYKRFYFSLKNTKFDQTELFSFCKGEGKYSFDKLDFENDKIQFLMNFRN